MCAGPLKWFIHASSKAPGPNSILGQALKVCGDQLADVIVPTCLKKTIVLSLSITIIKSADNTDWLHHRLVWRTKLPSMEDLYSQRCRKKANRIIKDPNQQTGVLSFYHYCTPACHSIIIFMGSSLKGWNPIVFVLFFYLFFSEMFAQIPVR